MLLVLNTRSPIAGSIVSPVSSTGTSVRASVAGAPTTFSRAIGVAAEHRAFCPDDFDRLPGPFATVAAELVREHVWGFWWDDRRTGIIGGC
ncbi:MAG: DUF4253 domain-containing protein [Pseudonocardiaceae bacterium]